ncbi:MAG: ATP-binding protein [Bdellovibrionales bacterium]|nr:ATP-binding protein [Bdellovibrionales bacterium]
MSTAPKFDPNANDQLICGLFSKKEAAQMIADGGTHIHSTTMGYRDEMARFTSALLNEKNPEPHPWQLVTNCREVSLGSSGERYKLIKRATVDMGIFSRRGYSEKVECVLEELITNGIYHAYANADGSHKYRRDSSVKLEDGEALKVRYGASQEGIFISVEDQGGRLSLEDIGSAFYRCYYNQDNQIVEDEQGSGLGLYMVFDLVTHFRVDLYPGKRTVVSCWIAGRRIAHPSIFSFNFFKRGA